MFLTWWIVDTLIGCRDSVGESHVRRVKCVATVNNTRVVTRTGGVLVGVIGLGENRNESLTGDSILAMKTKLQNLFA